MYESVLCTPHGPVTTRGGTRDVETQWHVFIIPHRTHLKFSKRAGECGLRMMSGRWCHSIQCVRDCSVGNIYHGWSNCRLRLNGGCSSEAGQKAATYTQTVSSSSSSALDAHCTDWEGRLPCFLCFRNIALYIFLLFSQKVLWQCHILWHFQWISETSI